MKKFAGYFCSFFQTQKTVSHITYTVLVGT